MTLRAGAAEIVITPPVGTLLDGYGGREGGAVDVHDDLHARALVLDDGEARCAIVSCDLVGVNRRLVASIREQASAATGIPAEHIMVAATHTHAGPAGLRREIDAPLAEIMSRTVAGAIAAAERRLRPAVLKTGEGSVDTVSQNRRHPDGPFDQELRVLLFDSPDPRDGAVAAILNFACHPTVLFATNMQISADYPGHAIRTVQRIVGDAPVLFLNGACGDVNPAWIEQRHDEAERVGSIVGAEAARRLQELRPLGLQQKAWNIRWDELTDKPIRGRLVEPRIRVASRSVDVPLRRLDAPERYDAQIAPLEQQERALAVGDREGRRRIMEQLTRLRTERGVAERIQVGGETRHLHAEVQAIALGDGCVILGLPGEFFVETARAIRAALELPQLLVACYANHYIGYLVPEHAFGEGGYEAGVAMVDETAEATMREAAIALVREVTAVQRPQGASA